MQHLSRSSRRARGVKLGAALAATAALGGGALAYALGQDDPGRSEHAQTAAEAGGAKSEIESRIEIAGSPWRITTGAGYVWLLTRAPNPALWRVDPASNEVVGTPTSLPVDPWNLTVGAGSVWVAPNGADGRIMRVDAESGRIAARISAHPIYLGGEIAFGGGYVWTGNDDERYRQGRTVSKIDPATNRVVGRPTVLGSPQSLAFGAGALWDADHSGWLVKVDPVTQKISKRTRLEFGPHGVVVAEGAVFVAASHDNRLLKADPKTGRIFKTVTLPLGPVYPAYGEGGLWTGSEAAWQGQADDRIVRIDPKTLTVAETVHVGGDVLSVAVGFGSVWAALRTGEVVRVKPAEAVG